MQFDTHLHHALLKCIYKLFLDVPVNTISNISIYATCKGTVDKCVEEPMETSAAVRQGRLRAGKMYCPAEQLSCESYHSTSLDKTFSSTHLMMLDSLNSCGVCSPALNSTKCLSVSRRLRPLLLSE
jgi:hypothetical protein